MVYTLQYLRFPSSTFFLFFFDVYNPMVYSTSTMYLPPQCIQLHNVFNFHNVFNSTMYSMGGRGDPAFIFVLPSFLYCLFSFLASFSKLKNVCLRRDSNHGPPEWLSEMVIVLPRHSPCDIIF